MAPINRTIKNTALRVFCELIIAYSPFSKHETIIGKPYSVNWLLINDFLNEQHENKEKCNFLQFYFYLLSKI